MKDAKGTALHKHSKEKMLILLPILLSHGDSYQQLFPSSTDQTQCICPTNAVQRQRTETLLEEGWGTQALPGLGISQVTSPFTMPFPAK